MTKPVPLPSFPVRGVARHRTGLKTRSVKSRRVKGHRAELCRLVSIAIYAVSAVIILHPGVEQPGRRINGHVSVTKESVDVGGYQLFA